MHFVSAQRLRIWGISLQKPENWENEEINSLENIQKIKSRRRPETVAFCPLSWLNMSSGNHENYLNHDMTFLNPPLQTATNSNLSGPVQIEPPYCALCIAIPLSHCVFQGVENYSRKTPLSPSKRTLSQQRSGPREGMSHFIRVPFRYRAIGGNGRDWIANHKIGGH